MVYPSMVEEERYIQSMLESDEKFISRLETLYDEAQDDVQGTIDQFIVRNVRDDKISYTEARLPADLNDRYKLLRNLENTRSKDLSSYVERDIIYSMNNPNLTRLQLLDNHIYLNIGKLDTQQNQLFEEYLTNIFTDEYLRQHNNLGFTPTAEQYDNIARTIVHESFNGAEWSQRLNAHSGQLRRDLFSHVQRTVLSGKHPSQGVRDIAKEIKKSYTGRKNLSALQQAKMLAVTEAGRVQTAVQKYSYEKYDITEFEFIGEPSACDKCSRLIGKTFKTTELEAGVNACPIHPRCRCSTIPKINREDWEERMKERGL